MTTPTTLHETITTLTTHPSDDTFPVTDPATGHTIAHVHNNTVNDALNTITTATTAQPTWAATPPRKRAELLLAVHTAMLNQADTLATLITLENGKPLPDAHAEITYAAEFFRWYSEEAVRTDGQYGTSPTGGTRTIVTHRPVGVAALITPWNFPAAMATRKIAPALAAGCTVVLKPASETPLTALAIGRILHEVGVPDGVVNVVPSKRSGDVVAAWLADTRVRKVSFTGSTPVGRVLLRQAAERIVNASMELGGNAPFIVAADADVEAAVAGAMLAKLRNGGQACTAANRFYVHADIAQEFTERFGTAVAGLRVGPAAVDGTQIGPLISAKAVAGVSALVNEAVAAGARVAYLAHVPDQYHGGFFYPPTVLTGVSADSPIVREEIFGPVAPTVTWTDDAQLLDLVNASEFGLAAYVFSQNLGWALRTAERIDAGMVGINRGAVSDPAAPFGGFKQSGLGREGARDGLREFTETQYFSVDWA